MERVGCVETVWHGVGRPEEGVARGGSRAAWRAGREGVCGVVRRAY